MKALRTAKGFSQEDLSKLTPLTRNTIWRIEAGLQKPSIDTTVQIAFALGANLREISPEYADYLEAVGVSPSGGPGSPSSVPAKKQTTTAGQRQRDSNAATSKVNAKKAGGQRRKSPRKKRSTGWSRDLAA